jgi:hypothetical protein
MSFKSLFFLVPVLSFVSLTGCKTSCTGLCDDAKDADCATTNTQTIGDATTDNAPKSLFDHDECYAMCERESDMEDDNVSCDKEFSTLKDCISSQDDICKAWQPEDFEADVDAAKAAEFGYEYTTKYKMRKCNSEWQDYESCVADFCADHSKRDYCNPVTTPITGT